MLELTQRPAHLRQLMTQRVGSRVLMELLMYHTTRVADSDGSAATQICQAVVTAMDAEEGESLWEHPVAHVLVKNWLKTESEHGESPMATALCQAYKGKLVSQMAQTNRGAFCLLALSSTTDANLKKSIAQELKKGRKELTKKCDGTHTKGYEALLAAIPK
uniref:CPL domain-containing protein n=1 Tax=Proboscia inermis TaxID=420281 RepID=A0A7S0GFE1_9STRA